MLSLLVLSQFLVPLDKPDLWQSPPFDNHTKNTVVHDTNGLVIQVEKSSSPIFFKLPEKMEIKSFSVEGNISGLPHLDDKMEGVDEGDDFALRIGLVSPGERPGWLKRLFLPKWIKALLEIDPEQGFSQVSFYNVTQKLSVGEKREHPKWKDIYEESALQMKAPGNFGFTKELPAPIPTFALWLQSDGDDTQSTFIVKIKRLFLCETPPGKK